VGRIEIVGCGINPCLRQHASVGVIFALTLPKASSTVAKIFR
jgi:hypothetical protein